MREQSSEMQCNLFQFFHILGTRFSSPRFKHVILTMQYQPMLDFKSNSKKFVLEWFVCHVIRENSFQFFFSTVMLRHLIPNGLCIVCLESIATWSRGWEPYWFRSDIQVWLSLVWLTRSRVICEGSTEQAGRWDSQVWESLVLVGQKSLSLFQQ